MHFVRQQRKSRVLETLKWETAFLCIGASTQKEAISQFCWYFLHTLNFKSHRLVPRTTFAVRRVLRLERRARCHLFLQWNSCAIVRSALCRLSNGWVGAFVHQLDISVGGNGPITGGLGKARPSEPELWTKS